MAQQSVGVNRITNPTWASPPVLHDGLILPNKLPSIPLPPIVFGHGAGVGPAFVLSDSGIGSLSLLQKLADLGYVIAVPSLGGEWANNKGMTGIKDGIAYARANGAHPTAKAILLGASMGGGTVLRYAALNPHDVLGVVTFIPALDFNAIITSNVMSLRAQINTAWGRATTDTTTLPVGTSPSTLTTALSQIHQQHWVATDDTVSENYAAFASATGCDMRTVGALGHSVAAVDAANDDEVIRFIKSLGHRAASEAITTFDPLSIGWQGAWWLSAQSSPGDGQPIGTLEDSTANNNDLVTLAGGANRPTYYVAPTGFNGKPAAYLSGISGGNAQYWATGTGIWTGAADDQPFDVCMILRQSAVVFGSYKCLFSQRTGTQATGFTNNDIDWWIVAGGSSCSFGEPDTKTHALVFRFNGANCQIYQDGTLLGTNNSGTNTMADLIVGCYLDATSAWGGHIAWISKKQGTLLTNQELFDWSSWARAYYGVA